MNLPAPEVAAGTEDQAHWALWPTRGRGVGFRELAVLPQTADAEIAVKTGGGSHPAVTEDFVTWVWAAQRFRTDSLRDHLGHTLEVVYRGRRWGQGRADFQDALIAFDGRLEQGDVEVHVRSSDWHAHGHHMDPHYDRVVLHVVLWRDMPVPPSTSDGRPLRELALGDWCDGSIESLYAEYRALDGQTPDGPSCGPGLQALGHLLERAGLARFRGRVARFQGDLCCLPPDEALYRATMGALGYSTNGELFRTLAEWVPMGLVRSMARQHEDLIGAMEAMLLGTAGLLPSQTDRERTGQQDHHPHVQHLEAIWGQMDGRHVARRLARGDWQVHRVRPCNRPARRMAGAARLLAQWAQDVEFPHALLERVRDMGRSLRPRLLARPFMAADPGGYWSLHADFGLSLRRPSPGLIGQERAGEIVVNVLLPFAAAWGACKGDRGLEQAAERAFLAYPRGTGNHVTRHMVLQLAGAGTRGLVRSACHEQGLVHLFKGWCRCRDCRGCMVSASRQ